MSPSEVTTVRVASVTGRRYTTELVAGSHTITADEAADLGGDDLGPSPFQLALLALGACASITLEMYAARKGWPLEEVAIEVEHRAVVEDGVKRDRIERRIRLVGDLDTEMRARLLAIAGRCPVARLMQSQPEIIDSEVEAPA